MPARRAAAIPQDVFDGPDSTLPGAVDPLLLRRNLTASPRVLLSMEAVGESCSGLLVTGRGCGREMCVVRVMMRFAVRLDPADGQLMAVELQQVVCRGRQAPL